MSDLSFLLAIFNSGLEGLGMPFANVQSFMSQRLVGLSLRGLSERLSQNPQLQKLKTHKFKIEGFNLQ